DDQEQVLVIVQNDNIPCACFQTLNESYGALGFICHICLDDDRHIFVEFFDAANGFLDFAGFGAIQPDQQIPGLVRKQFFQALFGGHVLGASVFAGIPQHAEKSFNFSLVIVNYKESDSVLRTHGTAFATFQSVKNGGQLYRVKAVPASAKAIVRCVNTAGFWRVLPLVLSPAGVAGNLVMLLATGGRESGPLLPERQSVLLPGPCPADVGSKVARHIGAGIRLTLPEWRECHLPPAKGQTGLTG